MPNNMRPHDILFWCATFFLAGILIGSIFSDVRYGYSISVGIVLLGCIATYALRRPRFAIIGLAALIGISYYFFFLQHEQSRFQAIIVDQPIKFTGIVRQAEARFIDQKIYVGLIQITAPRYPELKYGDRISVSGIIRTPEEKAKNYFFKEGIGGVMRFPKITIESHKNGSSIRAALLGVKSFFEQSFRAVLPAHHAAFLSGLLLGDTSKFSDDFRDDMRRSGTSHLVALSGYNISVVAAMVATILGSWWLTKKFLFPASVLFIVGFVIMTGAEASVVRAAIMAGLLLGARALERPYYFRNALIIAATSMVVINPRLLVFDIGFQLSFLALIGIVYVRPLLTKLLQLSSAPGIFKWREHFLNTTSAQLTVLPLLLYHFGFVSPMGIVANVAILEFVPVTMALGFITGLGAIISGGVSWILSWPLEIFLGYELWVIHICATATKFLGL